MIPHPDKIAKGGEDAYYIGKNILAVADGVGGWAEIGIDPGKYSKELCKHIATLVEADWNTYKTNPKTIIVDAAAKTKNQGSSTLCILTLDEITPILHTAYIGDSGYIIFRKESNSLKVIYKSEEHCRGFNFPYQIGTNGDPPNMSLEAKHEIKHNDVVIAGTDGLFDNLDEKQIMNCVKPFLQYSEQIPDIGLVAEMIAKHAYQQSLDPVYFSPFAKKAREHYFDYRGGKSDDITVLVGQIVLSDNPKEEEQQPQSPKH